MTSETDVLIIGAGPAGLMLALWLSRLGVNARIIDKRTDKVFSGQADGFQARSLEILDSFGIAEHIWKESNHMIEVSFWNPDSSGSIRRNNRVSNCLPDQSRFYEVVLQQGRAESFFLDAIRASYGDTANGKTSTSTKKKTFTPISVERMVEPASLLIDESLATSTDPNVRPVTVTLRHLTEAEATPTQVLDGVRDGLFRSNLTSPTDSNSFPEGCASSSNTETVRCKYVVGCDGAHSWTRKALGPEYAMVGETTDSIWGVLDIIPITDFPDIRFRTIVHSASSGSIMIIPRENRLVRLYIQLTDLNIHAAEGGRVDRSGIRPETMMAAARKILSPYHLDYNYCDWWTAYQIGQRVGEHFSKLDRVFLAGDAVHTHSPKAGQGMNVSMQDTYNLGWKLGLMCKGVLQTSVLATYEFERRAIARQLIAFDQRFSRLFSGRPARDVLDETGVSMEELEAAFRQSHLFTTAIGIRYEPSVLSWTGESISTPFASSTQSPSFLVPGMRFASQKVIRLADHRLWEFHHKMPSDGRFRLVVFGGSNTTPSAHGLEHINSLGTWIATALLPRLPTMAIMPGAIDLHGGISVASPSWNAFLAAPTQHESSIVDVLLLLLSPKESNMGLEEEIPLLSLHPVFHPVTPQLDYDFDKVFVDKDGSAYAAYGLEGRQREEGALVIVRPDGYVGLVASPDEHGKVSVLKWFEGVVQTTPL